MPSEGGLGSNLVGDKFLVNSRSIHVTKLLGEGGFSFVYLVKELSDTSAGGTLNNTVHGAEGRGSGGKGKEPEKNGKGRQGGGSLGKDGEHKAQLMCLKVTSIVSRQQRDIAEKEAKLLSRLSHPSIIKMFDTCYRTVPHSGSSRKGEDAGKSKERPQHLILMEFCEGGHALDVCNKMAAAGERYDLSTLIIAFGQICNAVSYLHAQRPPIVHRDLKPANFLVKDGAYKLCDFGSAVFGHVELKTPQARSEAEEVVQKTTTQMFRSPEMVDLYMAKKLTQATDVWALGVCLYSMAYLQNCFEEGSNLAILSRKYKIPDDNPYGEGLVELIDRMLTMDSKARCDMTEVILCLSAVYSGRPLPPRKERTKKEKKEKTEEKSVSSKKERKNRGTFKTDGQGIYQDGEDLQKKPKEAKKLDPNSAAARRRQAASSAQKDDAFANFNSKFDEAAAQAKTGEVNQDMAFSTTSNPFASFEDQPMGDAGQDFFGTDAVDDSVKAAFDTSQNWGMGTKDAFADEGDGIDAEGGTEDGGEETNMLSEDGGGPATEDAKAARRSRSSGARRPRRKDKTKEGSDVNEDMSKMSLDDTDHNDEISTDDAPGGKEKSRRSTRRNSRGRPDENKARRRSNSKGVRRDEDDIEDDDEE